MDEDRADFNHAMQDVKTQFNADVFAVTFPIGKGADFTGIVDVLHGVAYQIDANGKEKEIPIPDSEKKQYEEMREVLAGAAAEGDEDLLVKLGKTYVMFFCENHEYYYFIISRSNTKMDLLSEFSKIENSNQSAFNILKSEATKVLQKADVPNQAIQDKIIAMWALVQGLVTIMIMNDITYSEIWEEKIEEIIKSVCIVK